MRSKNRRRISSVVYLIIINFLISYEPKSSFLNNQRSDQKNTIYYLSSDDNNKNIKSILSVHQSFNLFFRLLAKLIAYSNDFETAIQLYQNALLACEFQTIEDQLFHAATLHELGNVHRAKNHYLLADKLLEQSAKTYEKYIGKKNLSYASSLYSLGVVRLLKGSFDEAQTIFLDVKKIYDALSTNQNFEYAANLHKLGWIAQAKGDYINGERLYQQTLQIYENTASTNSRDYADVVHSLGTLCQADGRLSQAEHFYQQALHVYETTVGRNVHSYAITLHAMGTLYQEMGEHDHAEQLLLHALQVKKKTVGEKHRDYGVTLNALGSLYFTKREFNHAENLYLSALQAKQTSGSSDNRNVASTLHALGRLYQVKNEYLRAETYYQQSLQVKEKSLGVHHRTYASALHALGWLYQAMKRFDLSEVYYRRAIQTYEQSIGSQHPIVAGVFSGFSSLQMIQGKPHSAMTFLKRAINISELQFRRELSSMTETRRDRFSDIINSQNDLLYSWAAQNSQRAAVSQLALSVALIRKGRTLDEAASVSAAAYSIMGADDRREFDNLRLLRSGGANLSMRFLDAIGPQQEVAAIQELNRINKEADRIEQHLAQRSAALGSRRLPAMDRIVSAVAATIPGNGALVEIVEFEPIDFYTLLPRQRGLTHYLALVLTADRSIAVTDLGSAQAVNGAVDQLLKAYADPASNYAPAARQAYNLILAPLLPLLRGKHHIMLAADGRLNLLNFATLQDAGGHMPDERLFSYLTSGRDLLKKSIKAIPHSDVLVLADPEFALSLGPQPQHVATSRHRSARFSLGSFARLPGTRQEAEAILHLWPQARVLVGPEATDIALLNAQAPGILHVATHGIFDIQRETMQPVADSRTGIERMPWREIKLQTVNPLLRSALVLAPAQKVAGQPGIHPMALGQPDGLVTALEMASMNLWGTQLVVLSACDSGQGDIHRGQGVYGLRRAVLAAGAETLVTSLWKVNDAITKDLMAAYYQALRSGLGRAAALQQSVQLIRQENPHPYYWGAFILIGQTGPLKQTN